MIQEISNQVLNTMYNLCRLSKSRQEEAAMNNIIPVLQNIVKTERPLKEFALPILCDMAHSGKMCRKLLWQNSGLEFYVSLLSDPYWQVTALDAIFVWLQEETARVEEKLLEDANIRAIVRCFTTSKTNAFENTLEPLQKLLRLSLPIALAVGKPEFLSRIHQKLTHHKPVVRLNLLKILRTICDASEQKEALIRQHGMYSTVHRLAERDAAVLVRNMASDLIKACNDRIKGSLSSYRNPSRRRSSAAGSSTNSSGTSSSAGSSRRHVSSLWAAPTLVSSAKEHISRPSTAGSVIPSSTPAVAALANSDRRRGSVSRSRSSLSGMTMYDGMPPPPPIMMPQSPTPSPLRNQNRQRAGNPYVPRRHRTSLNQPQSSPPWDD